MNSAATHPGAQYTRGIDTFTTFDDYRCEARRRIARRELAVDYSVSDISLEFRGHVPTVHDAVPKVEVVAVGGPPVLRFDLRGVIACEPVPERLESPIIEPVVAHELVDDGIAEASDLPSLEQPDDC